VVGPLCMHVLTFLCRESAAATFLLPGYQHDHIVQSKTASSLCEFTVPQWGRTMAPCLQVVHVHIVVYE